MATPNQLAETADATWTDAEGRAWKVPRVAPGLRVKWEKYRRLRDFVRARGGHRCARCGSTGSVQVDAIVPRVLGGSTHPENLQLLCAGCQGERTGGLHTERHRHREE